MEDVSASAKPVTCAGTDMEGGNGIGRDGEDGPGTEVTSSFTEPEIIAMASEIALTYLR